MRFPNNPTPYSRCIIVRSAPFGLISHSGQLSDLFANVYLADLKSWKQISLTVPTTLPANIDPLAMTNLTTEDIINNLRRYFIHKTGIEPKGWMMVYIEQEFNIKCGKHR